MQKPDDSEINSNKHKLIAIFAIMWIKFEVDVTVQKAFATH